MGECVSVCIIFLPSNSLSTHGYRIKLVSQFSRRDESRPVQTQESDNNLL